MSTPAPSTLAIPLVQPQRSHPSNASAAPPYTVFSVGQKYTLVLLTASVAMWSTIGSPIYYPALGTIEEEFSISEELVNISVVVYLICQGIFPTIIAGLADIYGRRPIILLGLAVFIGSSIGIALTKSYAVLLVLRCIQSTGISPTVAVCSGIMGDFTQRHERGTFVGLQSGIALLGQAFGPLIGAGLIAGFNWRSIFWFLTIGGGVSLMINSLILPETKRSFVGNGSVMPKNIINKAPILMLPSLRRMWRMDNPDYDSLAPEDKRDLLAPIKILAVPEVAICLFCAAIHFALWVVSLTCLTTQLSKSYGYDIMDVGLCYLPAGIGGLLGSVVAGRSLDYVYRRLHGKFLADKKEGKIPESTEFKIVSARVVVIIPFAFLADGFAIMYGWCLYEKVHIAAVCVSCFFISMCCLAVVNSNMTMMIDLYPERSSAATSCVNFARCCMAALFVGVLTYMNNAMTIGGTMTLLAALGLLATASLWVPVKYAAQWKAARGQKEKKQEQESGA